VSSRAVRLLMLSLLIALSVLAGIGPARAAVSAPVATEATPIIYFYTEGCSECQAVDLYLTSLESKYNVTIYKKFDALDKAGAGIRASLDEQYGVPVSQRGVAPTIFVGDHVFVREKAIKAGLEDALRSSTALSRQHLLDAYKTAETGGGTQPADTFKTFSVMAIVGAGLLDGINACAFATFIFFVSFLMLRSKAKRDILFIGLAFSLGVFIAYLAAGLGLYQLVSRVKWFFGLSKWFYVGMGIFTAVIAVLSARDAWRTRHGNLGDMTLQLPEQNKGMIHKLIRGQARTGFGAMGAFLIAFPVSLIEFMCTGETYLPTIVLIFSEDVLRQRALLFLIIYNVLQILPLVIMTNVAYFGVSSDHLVTWMKKNTMIVKVATAVLMVALSSLFLVRGLTLFGVLIK
jgi:hypothetical protein